MSKQAQLLSDGEAEAIILSALDVGPHDEEAIRKLIRWAESTRISQLALEGVLAGTIKVYWQNGDITFRRS